jgi:pimeloyl-ACP methyl ester carboxylesterase
MSDFASVAFGAMRQDHDLVFIDARGTGRSGKLHCRLYATPRDAFGDFYPATAVRACRDSLSRIADLTQYTTEAVADDIDDVRSALGYDRIDIYGTSYGTRLGLVYLRRHGEHVRAMVLKSVAPPDMAMPMSYARDAERATSLLFRDCAADAACAAAFPALEREFDSVVARARRGALLAVPPGAPSDTVTITSEAFGTTILGMEQSTSLRATVPLLIHQAYAGNTALLSGAIAQYRDALNSGNIAIGMHLSVMCAEDFQRVDLARSARDDAPTFLGDARVRAQAIACGEWPAGKVSATYFTPVRSNVPVLLVSGNLDPNTPPRLAEQVRATLPNARHVILPTVAHAFSDVARCGANFMQEFFDRASTRVLDVTCANTGRLPPFALGERR